MKRIHFFLEIILFAVFFLPLKINAQNELLPLDKSVRHGKLANGFSYYVRKNESAKKIVSVSFVVKAGFLHEDQDQLEVSHWLEHVTLTGSKNYPEGAFHYLKKLGMRTGDQLNATTGYLYTHYKFDVPADSIGAISLALRIARDIATDAHFKDLSVSTEQSAVVTEKLGAMGVSMREIDAVTPKLFGNSYFAKRGIGAFSFESFKKIPKKNLIRFYRDWYRPDLEAIMVVGNINEEDVVHEIEQLFSSIPIPDKMRPYIKHKQFNKGKAKYILHTDTQSQNLDISMYTQLPEEEFATKAHLERLVKLELFGELMKRRISDITELSAGNKRQTQYVYNRQGLASMPGINVGRMIAYPLYARDIENSVTNMIRESKRVEQFGFLPDELSDAKLRIKNIASDTDKSSHAFIEDYIDHLTRGYAFLSPEFYSKEVERILSHLDLPAIHAFAKQILSEVEPDIVIVAPESKKDSLPSKTQWESFVQKLKNEQLSTYVRPKKAEYIAIAPVLRDSISYMSRTVHSGITELTLNNGIHIVLKPFKGEKNIDNIRVHAFSKYGAGHYADNEYCSAINSVRIVEKAIEDSLMATGAFSTLTRKGISTRGYLDDFGVGVRGSSNVSDLDILMSRIYSYFNTPDIDQIYADKCVAENVRIKSSHNSSVILYDSIRSVIYENLRYIDNKKEGNTNSETINRCYREMFTDNSGAFTFLVTGNFEEEKVIPVITRYVGALTGSKSNVISRSNTSVQISNEVVHKIIHANDEQKAAVALRLVEPLQYSADNIYGSRFLEWFLQKRLLSRLRKKEGGLYGINVSARMFPGINNRLSLSLSFECPIDKAQTLIAAAKDEINIISTQGASPAEISEYVAYAKQDRETLIRDGFYWNNLLDEVYYLGNGISDLPAIIEMNENGINNFDHNLFIKNILNANEFSDFVLLPSPNITVAR